MLYKQKIAVYSQIHTKHINTLCGQNVELLNVELVVHIVTTGLFKEPYEVPVTFLQNVTERQHCKLRTDRQNNISNSYEALAAIELQGILICRVEMKDMGGTE